MAVVEYTENDLKNFWSHVNKTGACWLWTGALNFGYGHFTVTRKRKSINALAHCVTWVLLHGPVPYGYEITHHCPGGDNKACCNPAHLKLLTHLEHGQDKIRKRQLATGARNGQHTHPERRTTGLRNGAYTRPDRVLRGDNHPSHLRPETRPRGEGHANAKLTDDIVREIRRLRAAGGVTYQDIADKFDVDSSLVGLVIRHKIWKHVT